MSEYLQAKAMPDSDPAFKDLPARGCVVRDGVFLVRESEWIEFLTLITKKKFGEIQGALMMDEVLSEVRKNAH